MEEGFAGGWRWGEALAAAKSGEWAFPLNP